MGACLLVAGGVDVERRGDRLLVDGDVAVDGAALLLTLADAARAAGVTIHEGARAERLDPAGDGAIVRVGATTMRGTLLVDARGAWLAAEDDWLREVAVAARAQSLVATSGKASDTPAAITVGPGFAYAVARPDGAVEVGEGCQPSNRGDPFDRSPDAAVQSRLDELLAGSGLADQPRVTTRGARPLLFTCDGLPLVGPHPGRAHTLLCAGFNGADLAYAAIAGEWIADWIVDGRASGPSASRCSPRRML